MLNQPDLRSNIVIPRVIASEINPIISVVGTEDTLFSIASLIDEIGLAFSQQAWGKEDFKISHFHLLTSVLSAALYYEIKAPSFSSDHIT